MSSLLAYGSGFLAEDIWSGAGLSEPWHQAFGYGDGDGDGESSSACEEGESSGSQSSEGGGAGGGLSQFFKVIEAAAPREATVRLLKRSSTKKELHWDSPPQSPSTVFVHLPNSVLSIILTGTKADAVVIGLFQLGSDNVLEILLYLPKALSFAELVVFKPDLLSCVNGKVCSTDMFDLPPQFCNALKGRPQSFLALPFSLQKYNGIIFGLWRDGSKVPATAEAVFSDAVQSLPMLLSNRINARKYERLGRRFDAILTVIPDAVLFVDDECAQVVLNPAAASLLGLPNHGEVDPSKVAVAMRVLTERCSRRTDPQHWTKLLSTDEELEIEEDWELTMPRRVLHVRSYPVTGQAAHGRLWIYADVTEQRDAEEAIEAASRAKSQFLAMMSHELRTPMTGVLGMLDLLHLTNLELEQQGLVRIMQESAEGLMDVINNILDYCKIEAGRLQLEEIDFSLSDMFEQIQSMVKTSFLKKDLKLTISGEASGSNVVRGDPVRLRQVLFNIVNNAIKFTEDGSVDVSWRFLNPQWVDKPVVAMSQSSAGRSKLINQIINASRGEKCSVEHLTTPTGRAAIVVNCSSAGAAGPYLESSIISPPHFLSSIPSSFSQQNQSHSSTSIENSSSEFPKLSTSFPVLYSVGPETRPVPEFFQSTDTRHHFIERKSLAGKEPQRTPSYSDMATLARRAITNEVQRLAGKESTRTPSYSDIASLARSAIPDEVQTPPFSQKPLLKHPTSGSEETESRASKYRRLSMEKSSNVQGNTYQVDKDLHPKGIDKIPHWRTALESVSPTHRSLVRIPSGLGDTSSVRSKDVITENVRPHVCSGNVSSNEPEVKSDTGIPREEQKQAGQPTGLKFCKICKSVLYIQKEPMEIKPEDKVWLEVTISDTGVGIGKDQLDGLFVGSQAGNQRRNAAGTGLGLAICKGLLCLMNGKIQMESKIGDGTTVILTIPLLPAGEAAQGLVEFVSLSDATSAVEPIATVVQSTAGSESQCCTTVVTETTACETTTETKPAEAKDAESGKQKIKVLVAEDNRVNQLLIRKMFQHLGHQVEIVGNGKLAVEAVQRTTFDLVLMDVQMPILDGLSATKAIRGLPPPTSQIPIYALSADTPGSGPLEETGLDGYLKKPIVWDVISRLADDVLASQREL